MRLALVNGRLTFAGPDVQGVDAVCPGCRGAVRLNWSRQGTYFWRHKHPPRGGCPLVKGRPGDEVVYAIVVEPATLKVRFGPVRDDDLEKLVIGDRECETGAVELPDDGPFVLVLAGPGTVVLAGEAKVEGDS
jgi:hypothetical protein